MSQTIPISLPDDLLAGVRATVNQAHLSVQDVFQQSTRLGLPKLREQLANSGERITNVDPLPDEILERIYARPERDEAGVEQLMQAQAFGGRD